MSFLASSARRVSPPPNRRSQSAPAPPAISIEEASQGPLTNVESHPPSPTQQPKRSETDGTAKTQDSATSSTWRRRGSAWQRRHKPANVYWRKRWDSEVNPWINGRVLIIDCYSRDHSDDGKRKVLAYEFNTEKELREFYETGAGANDGHCLRIMHVQNAIWARSFLLRKFNISDGGSNVAGLTGTSFGRWAVYDKPQRRAGKPVLNSKSFRCSRDPWRGISRTGFGVDYLKYYHPNVVRENDITEQFKLSELNHWDSEKGNVPTHGYDVYVQRLSVYVQRNEGPVNMSPDGDTPNPYAPTPRTSLAMRRLNRNVEKVEEMDTLPLIESMDNDSTIIVFEASHTGDANDTLIQARGEMEGRWRRLMQLLPREDIPNEDQITAELMNIVMKDIMKALQVYWDQLLAKCDEHVSILEEKIYENPADESRAPELWTNSALWLKVEKLISLQLGTIGEVQNNMKELADDVVPHEEWLHHTPDEFRSVETMVQEQLVKPTANLSDLVDISSCHKFSLLTSCQMYKSVGIRDARHSLQLGLSMWRLSWITFIFLPLTFIGGFFGMNVDTFQSSPGYPSIKWYFAAAVPLMGLVVVLYFVFKRVDRFDGRNDPAERGAYEHVFQDFASEFPGLWSRYGPRDTILPTGFWNKMKWRLINYWFDPSRTVAAKSPSDVDEMGIWAKIKRRITTRWLKQLNILEGLSLTAAERGEADVNGDFGPVAELLAVSTPVAMADGDPAAALRLGSPQFRRILPTRSRARSSRSSSPRQSGDALQRPTSAGSGPMVDEEKSSDDDSSDREGRRRSVAVSMKPLSPKEKPKERPETEATTTGAEQTRSSSRDSDRERHIMHLGVPMAVRRGDEHAP